MSTTVDTKPHTPLAPALALALGSDEQQPAGWFGIGLQAVYAERLRQELAAFPSTEPVGRHHHAGVVVRLSEGACHLADAAGCFWLLDQICAAQRDPLVRGTRTQIWTLGVRRDHSASLCCGDGRGLVLHDRVVAWTDFPLAAVAIRVEHGVASLRSER